MPGKNRQNVGILAHVDAGKTTLSEAMLYLGGALRKIGRVDNKDAFLDTDLRERERGITIFSKQAVFSYEDTEFTLLDTPGHVDFSTEMERVLSVMDYAILVISAADGIQGHTMTLWELLSQYQVPVFLFVNKMDQPGTEKEKVLSEIQTRFRENVVDFTRDISDETFLEEVAMSDESVMEAYFADGKIEKGRISGLIRARQLFPCYFGSALKLSGVEELLLGMSDYMEKKAYPEEFGARIFKITRDEQGNRLTHLKVTGGSFQVKDLLQGKNWKEKVNQIRIYSGKKFEPVNEVEAGQICAVTGLSQTRCGEVLGTFEEETPPVLAPVLTYQIVLPPGMDAAAILPKLYQLAQEEPALSIVWREELKEIHVQVMGQVQMEILQSLIQERFGIGISFENGSILYKETIAGPVEGAGHFEPLRHYAEVHLLLEPLPRGSGLRFASDCREEVLEKNWQRLVLTHLREKQHKGVLTGAPITDMKLTLISGRAHLKHTEGGDFREAACRAVRQGLRKAESILLEPYYQYQLEVPEAMVGRAMTDLEKMSGKFELTGTEAGRAVLKGEAPVATLWDYQREVTNYTKGEGKLFCRHGGYAPCHNALEVIEAGGYDADADIWNPSSSVFCEHGSGVYVPWDEADERMHVLSRQRKESFFEEERNPERETKEEVFLGTEEIDRILDRTFFSNSGDTTKSRKEKQLKANSRALWDWEKEEEKKKESLRKEKHAKKPEYLLVDGYNVLFAWEETRELAEENLDAAKARLLDLLCNYQGMCGMELMVVFDAYRVEGHRTECFDYHNIRVVYTREAETADQYIEKFAHQNGKNYHITVATSDGLEQVIIRSQGCFLLSARELRSEVFHKMGILKKEHMEKQKEGRFYLADGIGEEAAKQLEKIRVRAEKEE